MIADRLTADVAAARAFITRAVDQGDAVVPFVEELAAIQTLADNAERLAAGVSDITQLINRARVEVVFGSAPRGTA